MSIGNSVIFGMMHQKMDWLGQRQRVLAQNIANADTPDYRARDLEQLSFKDTVSRENMQVALRVSDPQHVALPEQNDRFRADDASAVYETSIDENSVVLEEQMIKISETAGEFNMATNIYRKYLALHRAALGRGQG